MTQYTGRVFITIDGKRIRSKEGATLDTGGATRAAARSDAGVDGFTEAIGEASVDFTFNHRPDISIAEIHAIKDGTLLYETDSGSVFTLRQAWSATPPKMTKGEVSCRFEAVECIEG